MDLQLNGKSALVTGAGSGIGRQTALLLAAEGVHVIGTDLKFDPDDTELAAACARQEALSVTDRAAMARVLQQARDQFGALHILINNAGIARNVPAPLMKDGEVEQLLEVNLRAVFDLSRDYFALQKKTGGGAFVNVASVLGMIGAPLASVYGATKGAVISLTRSLAMEWVKYNFRVNAVCPGLIETPMTVQVQKNKMMRETNLKDIPMQRFGHPDEIARAILFFASPLSSFITGQHLAVDGGFTAK